MNHLDKIAEYSKELYRKIKKDRYDIPKERQIELGYHLFISGIYLKVEGIGNFVDVHFTDSDIYTTMSMDVLSDSILAQIAHILRREI